MLSLTTGRPFALIKGGVHDGKTLKVIDNPTNEDFQKKIQNDPIEILQEMGFFKKLKKTPKKSFEALRELVINEGGEVGPELEELYEKAKKVLAERNGKEFILEDGELQLMPNPNPETREELYISAPTGSGKTYFACEYLSLYQKMFKRPVIVFSYNDLKDKTIHKFEKTLKPTFVNIHEDHYEEEPSDEEEKDSEEEKEDLYATYFDKDTKEKKPKRGKKRKKVLIGKEVVVNPIDPSELDHSAVFFDDIQYVKDPDVKAALMKLEDQVIGIGRHEDITVVKTGHLTTNYKATRLILQDVNYVVIYPRGGTSMGMKYFMQKYMGLDNETMNRILNVPSRWVCLAVKYPQFVLYKTGCFILHDTKEKK